MIDNLLYNIGTFGADNEGTEIRIGRGAGRIANKEILLRNEGRDLRNKLCDELKRKGLTRGNTQVRRDRHNRATVPPFFISDVLSAHDK